MLKLNIGLSRKVGEANFGSRGASINLETEVESCLLRQPDELQERIRYMFRLAKQSVDEELNGQAGHNGHDTNGRDNNGYNGNGSQPARNGRPATSSQVRAIHAIASRHSVDLTSLLQSRFNVGQPEQLSITEASQLIDELKSQHNEAGRTPMITMVAEPNDVAEGLIGRDYLSFSAVSTFQRCPLQFYFRYVEGLPEASVSSSLVFGGAIHSAVEYHFNELLAGGPAPDLDTLLDIYQEAWRERELDQVKFGKSETVDSLGATAERVITAFQSSDFAKPDGTIVGVEEELRGSLMPECPDLLARVDLLVDSGDALVVTDLKTARSRWSQGQAEDNAEQLLLYSELAKTLMPEKLLRLQFAVVTKAKTPVVECHEVALNASKLERTKSVVRQVWSAIEARNFYPAPSPMVCSTCPFKEPCRSWHG